MDKNAMQIRHENWRKILLECYASGLSKKQWCKENGIRSRKLYYWQKIVREEELKALEAARDDQNTAGNGTESLLAAEVNGQEFVELKPVICQDVGHGVTFAMATMHPEITLLYRGTEVHVHAGATKSTLQTVLEVIRDAD